jgi:hypothetical protein
MAKEALDSHSEDNNLVVLQIFRKPNKIEELDLEDYSKHLSEKKKCNMKVVIDFINLELRNQYADVRKEY